MSEITKAEIDELWFLISNISEIQSYAPAEILHQRERELLKEVMRIGGDICALAIQSLADKDG